MLAVVENKILRRFNDAMVKAIGATVGALDRTGEDPEYRFDLYEIPVALQISEFKKIKKEASFTNQVNEFFPENKKLKDDIKKALK